MPVLNGCICTLFGDSEGTGAVGGESGYGGVAGGAKQVPRGIGHILKAAGDVEVALALILVIVVGAGDTGPGLKCAAGSNI